MYFTAFLFLFLFLLNPLKATALGLLPVLPEAELPVFDKDFNCIDIQKAKTYIQDYNINTNSFGGIELCDNAMDIKKLFNDLKIIEEGYFSGSKTNIFIQNFVNASEYDYWVKTMTEGIKRGHDIPYFAAYNRGGYFTLQDGWSKFSTLSRVGLIIHEARHTAGYSHRTCDHGPYSQSNLKGCDSSVEEGGSHGVEMEYYSRVVLQGQNFHPVYKSMAKLMNLARANFVFNKYAMKQKEALFVLTNKEGLVLKDSKKTFIALSKEMLSKVNSLQLKRTSYGANLFNSNIALAIDVYSWAKKIQTHLIEDVYSYYKLSSSKRYTPFSVIDMEEVDFGTRRHLVSLSGNNKIRVFNFSKGEWFSEISVPKGKGSVLKTVSPTGEQGLFVVTKEGLIYPMDQVSLQLKSALTIKWPTHVKSYNVWEKKLLELRQDQKIYYTASGQPFSLLNPSEAVVDFVKIPLYDSFDF